MCSRLRIGFIGAGRMTLRHFKSLSQTQNIDIVGYVSPRSKQFKHASNAFYGVLYKDYRVFLEKEKPDAIWICIPPDQHGILENTLIDQKIPFFVEKPLGINRIIPIQIAKRVQEVSLVTAVGYQWRASSLAKKGKEVLSNINIKLIIGKYLGNSLYLANDWWLKKERSGGLIIEQTTHIIDFIRYLIGEITIDSAQAAYYKPSELAVTNVPAYQSSMQTESKINFTSHNGIKGIILASSIYTKPKVVELDFVCEDNSIISISTNEITKRTNNKKKVIWTIDDFNSEATINQDNAFLRAIRENNSQFVFSDYEDALKTHLVCMDIEEQMKEVNRIIFKHN